MALGALFLKLTPWTYTHVLALCSSSVFRPIHNTAADRHPSQRDRSGQVPATACAVPSLDFTKLNQHTRLWRWIVYSRATTSAMALRWVLPAGFFALGAISGGQMLALDSRGFEQFANSALRQCT